MFIAVSIVPVGSINVEKMDSESTEILIETIEEPSFPMSYDYVHNPNLGEDLLDSYDDYYRELDERYPWHFNKHLRNNSDYLYEEPFLDYPGYEDFRDIYRWRYGDQLPKEEICNKGNPKPKPNFADGKTWYVDDNATWPYLGTKLNPYKKIQDAIDATSDGDTVYVYSGFYQENVIVDKSIVLVGEDRNTTIIDGGGYDSHIVSVKSPSVNVSDFTLCNSSSECAGIAIYAGNNTFYSNIISSCGFGIRLFGYNDNTITRNIITGSEFGLAFWMSIGNKVTYNIIENNNGDGIVILEKSTVELRENEIVNNSFNGVLMIKSKNVTVEGNIIGYNGRPGSNWYGIQMFSSDNNIVKGNIIKNNFEDGISIYKSNKNTFLNNNILYNKDRGISLWFYSDNNTILGNNISFNDFDGINFSHSSDNTILGNIITNNIGNGIWFRWASMNTIDDNNISSNFFDGIILLESSDNIISDCTISNHELSGIHLDAYSSKTLIQDCRISNNWRGIKIDSGLTSNEIRRCLISGNHWGIKLANSMLNRIEQCTISDNYCGIMRGQLNFIRRNNFIDNKAFDAFGELKHKNFWVRNYWSGHNTLLPCYLYGLNVDWFPKASPYDYPTCYNTLEDDNTLGYWDGSTLLERDDEELDNHLFLRERISERLSSLFSRSPEMLDRDILRLDEHKLLHQLDKRNIPSTIMRFLLQ